MSERHRARPAARACRRCARQAARTRQRATTSNAAKALVEELRNARDYERMGQLAEAVSRRDPKDAKNRRLYAQYLIDTGKATAAVDLLQPLARRLPKDHPEFAEATGLLGRAYKQIFFDAGDKTSTGRARGAEAGDRRLPRSRSRRTAANTWHGVNLVALLDPRAAAGLARGPRPRAQGGRQGRWSRRSRRRRRRQARRMVSCRPWPRRRSVSATGTPSSATSRRMRLPPTPRRSRSRARCASSRRSGTSKRRTSAAAGWSTSCARGCCSCRAAALEMAPDDVQRLRTQPAPDPGQLEAVLGTTGPETYAGGRPGSTGRSPWRRSASGSASRLGTGFLVRAGDLGLEPARRAAGPDQLPRRQRAWREPGHPPEEAEVVFEAADPDQRVLGRPDPLELAARAARRDAPAAADAGRGHRRRCRSRRACPSWRRRRGSTSSAIPVGATSPSRSRTTSSSTTRARPPASRRSRASAACTTAHRPRAAAPAARCSTRGCGR